MRIFASTLCVAAVLGCAGVAFAAGAIPANISSAVSDAGRPEADTKRDEGRKPREMLVFVGVKSGSKVVDLLPGGGYFTRVFAKAAGPKGFIYVYYSNGADARLRSQGKDPDNQGADLRSAYANIGVIHGPLARANSLKHESEGIPKVSEV